MKCKKSLMGLAALLIVIFHFWITITKSPIEATIYRSAYIGVDIFFFVSAYSLAQRKEIKYGSFILNRLLYIYLPFIIMAGICGIYKHWTIKRFWTVVSGAEFFNKGGGSFLWFTVAIMILYLIAPLFIWIKGKFNFKAIPIFFALWGILVWLLQYVLHYKEIFILINRLPIFVIGMYYDDIRKLKLGKFKLPVILAGLICGGYLIHRFCGTIRLTKPITDIYYLIAIPFILSLVGLFDYISSKIHFRNLPLQFIGGITLELYGMQMIFGFDIENKILKSLLKTSLSMELKKLYAFLLTLLSLILIAWLFHLPKLIITKSIKHFKEKKNYEKIIN